MAINFLNSIESITLPGTTTDYYIGGSGGGVASNALKIGSRTTGNTIAMELFHATNPVSLGISYSGGDALAFIDSVHSSFDSVLQFKTGGDERFRVGALNANTFQIKPAAAGNDVAITDNSGNAILYSDTSTQRIGIGTTAPTAKLQIDSTSGWGVFTERGIKDGSTSTYSHNYGAGNAHILGRAMYFESSVVFSTSTADATTKEYRFSNASDKLTVKSLVAGNTFDDNILVLSGSNVGIGTASPTAKFHVTGSSSSGNLPIAKIESTGTISYLKFFNSSTGTGSSDGTYIGMNGGTAYFMNKEAGNLYLGTGDNFNLTLENGGNVGIGTTNPSSKLEVISNDNVGTTKIISAYSLSESQSTSLGYNSIMGSYSLDVKTLSTQPISFSPNSSEAMRITSAGNVGIGTTNPGDKLHVQDGYIRAAYSGGADFKLIPHSSNDGYGFYDVTNTNYDMWFDGGNVGIGTTSPSAKLDVRKGGTTAAQADTDLLVQDSSAGSSTAQVQILGGATGFSNLYFSDTAAYNVGGFIYNHTNNYLATNVNGSEKMRVTSAGYFGIGTTSPNTLLNLEGVKNRSIITLGSTTNDSGWAVGDKIGGIDFYSADGSGAGSGVKGSISYITSTAGSGGVTAMIFSAASSVSNNLERMRIDTSGNVGIGTTSPSQKLTVEGNIELGTGGYIYGDTTNPYLRLNNAVGTVLGYSTGNISIGPSFVYNNASGEQFRINHATGNVGIGTTSPTAKLHVSSDSGGALSEVAHFVGGGSIDDKSQISVGGNTSSALVSFGFRNTGSGFGYIANASDTEIITIDGGNERVGIGTSSPSTTLDVAGSITTSGIITGPALFEIVAQYTNRGRITLNSSTNTGANQISLLTDGNARMVVNKEGNVGIGTTSPSSKLQVSANDGDGITLQHGASNAFYILRSGNDDTTIKQTRSYTSKISISTLADSGTHESSGLNIVGQGSGLKSNIGIGTNSPTEKLEVYGGNLIVNDGTSKSRLRPNDLYLQSSGTINTWIRANGVSYFNGGNVGIGTTSPSAKLHVQGGASGYLFRVQGTSTLNVYDPGAAAEIGIGSGSGDKLKLFSNDSINNGITIDTSGNVGIGTTSPSDELTIEAETPTIRLKDISSSNYAEFYVNNFDTYLDSAGRTFIQNGGSTNVTVTSAGNVGIGTTSPSEKLHVAGGGSGNIRLDAGGTYYGTNIQAISSAGLKIGNDDFSGYAFFNDAGNAGIGTTTPSQKLEVDGEVLSDGYRVAAMQTAPSSRGDTGTLGEIRITADYIYVCYATDSWKRVAIAQW